MDVVKELLFVGLSENHRLASGFAVMHCLALSAFQGTCDVCPAKEAGMDSKPALDFEWIAILDIRLE